MTFDANGAACTAILHTVVRTEYNGHRWWKHLKSEHTGSMTSVCVECWVDDNHTIPVCTFASIKQRNVTS